MPIRPDLERVKELRDVLGTYEAVKLATKEARDEAIYDLRVAIHKLSPDSADFTADLRDVLGQIADLLED